MSSWASGFSGGGRAAYKRLQQGARRVPRGVWATVQVALLTLLLLAGVLPLYFSTVRRIRKQADDLEVLCGLYPNMNQTVVNNSYLSLAEDPRKPSDLFKADTIYEAVPVAPPPPAPPGAEPVDDAEGCFQQFESYCECSVRAAALLPHARCLLVGWLCTVVCERRKSSGQYRTPCCFVSVVGWLSTMCLA